MTRFSNSVILMNDSNLKVILQRAGDHSPVTINQDKCLIRTIHNDQHIDCCAIFNGPNGTALRSYTEDVLVNGEPVSAQWLNAGDQIQLPCSTCIEVKTATKQRPVFPSRNRSVAKVDAQLSGLLQENSVPVDVSMASDDSKEEVFLSPFSSDLSELDAKGVAPVQSVTSVKPVSPELQADEKTEIDTLDSQPSIAESLDADLDNSSSKRVSQSEELESVFARLGVLNVGPMTPSGLPKESDPVEVETLTAGPEVQLPVAAQAESETKIDFKASIRNELESVFSDAPDVLTPPSLDSSDAAPLVADAPVEREQVSCVVASTPVIPEHVTPTDPEAVLPSETVSPAVVESLLVPEPVAPTLVVEASVPQTRDPLSELPADLQNQLNDLVSSLEFETDKPPAEVQVPTPALHVEQDVEVSSKMFTPPVVEPMIDDSISSLHDEEVRSVQELVSEESVAAAVIPIAPVDVPVAVEAPAEPVVIVEPPAKKSQSVADILGSMGMLVPGADEMSSQPVAAEVVPSTVADMQKPVEAPSSPVPVPTSPVFANMQRSPQKQAATGASKSGEADDDIQAYMDRLLNRAGTTSERASDQSLEINNQVLQAPAPVEPSAVLSAEEFVPSHRPTRPENYDTLREIANSSSRNAVRQCTSKARKESIVLKAVACLVSLVCAAVTFWFGMIIPAEVFLVVAIVCGGLLFLNRDPVAKVLDQVDRGS